MMIDVDDLVMPRAAIETMLRGLLLETINDQDADLELRGRLALQLDRLVQTLADQIELGVLRRWRQEQTEHDNSNVVSLPLKRAANGTRH
jgi:hypothetical protein